jgi:hypothetical protein
VVPLSNQITTLNHKRFKGFKMFSDGHLANAAMAASRVAAQRTSKSSSFHSPDDRLAVECRNVTVMESYTLSIAENTAPGQPATGAFTDGRARMDIGSVIGGAPLALGVLIALGGILVTMSYLSE